MKIDRDEELRAVIADIHVGVEDIDDYEVTMNELGVLTTFMMNIYNDKDIINIDGWYIGIIEEACINIDLYFLKRVPGYKRLEYLEESGCFDGFMLDVGLLIFGDNGEMCLMTEEKTIRTVSDIYTYKYYKGLNA